MGRLIIKRSMGSKYSGGGLVVRRGPFTKNTRSESIGKLDEICDLKDGKGIADADVHMIAYYSTDGCVIPDEESCTTGSTSRSNSIEEEDNNSDNRDDDADDDESMNQSISNVDGVVTFKRKYQPSFVDAIINGTSIESQIAPQVKIRCLDTSILERRKNNEQLKDMNSEHTVSKIPPTERKKWPQKPCVHCWKNGIRNNTRYICFLCNAALCKEPCFSEYHCTK